MRDLLDLLICKQSNQFPQSKKQHNKDTIGLGKESAILSAMGPEVKQTVSQLDKSLKLTTEAFRIIEPRRLTIETTAGPYQS